MAFLLLQANTLNNTVIKINNFIKILLYLLLIQLFHSLPLCVKLNIKIYLSLGVCYQLMAQWTYFHNLDPFIIQFTESFGLRWYSMAYIMGFFVGYLLLKTLIKKKPYTFIKKRFDGLNPMGRFWRGDRRPNGFRLILCPTHTYRI